MNPSCVEPVSIEQIQEVVRFLPILESMNPDDFSRSVCLLGNEEARYGISQVEFHPAIHEFIRSVTKWVRDWLAALCVRFRES